MEATTHEIAKAVEHGVYGSVRPTSVQLVSGEGPIKSNIRSAVVGFAVRSSRMPKTFL